MKHLKLALLLLLGLFLLPEAKAQAPTISTSTQTICFESIKDYRVDWNGTDPLTGTPGSTYAWTLSAAVSGTASITTGQTTNYITVDWGTTPAGSYTNALSVIETTSGGCIGTVVNLTVIITPLITPTFTAIGPLCQNTTAPVLPISSTNTPAITGTWDAVLSTASAGTIIYTFTPDLGQCASTATMSVVATPEITPTFTQIGPLCQNSTAPILPTSSTNLPAITGTWNAVLSTASAGTIVYTFTPNGGQCAIPTIMSVVVTPEITPTFTQLGPLCQNSVAPVLPTSSNDIPAITGTWNTVLSTSNAGTIIYTFTPDAGICATTTTMSVLVNPTPTIVAAAPVCSTDLLTWSVGVTVSAGTLSSSAGTVVNTSGNNWTISGIPAGTDITLTSTALGCPGTSLVTAPDCSCPPITAPIAANASYCSGTPISTLTVSNGPAAGFTLNWYDAATGGNLVGTGTPFTPSAAGTYYAQFVENATSCTSQRTAVIVTEDALPNVTAIGTTTICEGLQTTLTANNAVTYSWSPSATLSSPTGTPVTATPTSTETYTVIGTDANGCTNSATVTVTVTPTPTTSPIFHD